MASHFFHKAYSFLDKKLRVNMQELLGLCVCFIPYNILPLNFTWEPGVLIAQSAHSSSLTTSSHHILHTAVRGDENKSAMHVACFEYKDLQGRPGPHL